jgi:hypothetical protein
MTGLLTTYFSKIHFSIILLISSPFHVATVSYVSPSVFRMHFLALPTDYHTINIFTLISQKYTVAHMKNFLLEDGCLLMLRLAHLMQNNFPSFLPRYKYARGREL